jgi:hypothetical protein
MRIPEDSIVPDDKITRYLLVPQLRNDKSKFLAQAGFTPENSEALKLAIQMQAVVEDAIEERRNEYGIFIPSRREYNRCKWRILVGHYDLAAKRERW